MMEEEPQGLTRLYVVGIHLAISEKRRRVRWGFLPIDGADDAWAQQSDPDLWMAMRSLDRRSRAALVMCVLEGYTQEEAASLLGVPRGTLASWLSRARKKLQPLLSEDESDGKLE